MPTVDSDNLAGAVLATEHLLGLGHRRIGFLGGRPDLESARLREEGFRQAMAAAGIAVDDELVAGRRLPAADGARAGPRAADPRASGRPPSSPRTTSPPSPPWTPPPRWG